MTERGGPANEMIELAKAIIGVLRGIMPTADPYLASLAGHSSVEVVLYSPPDEVDRSAITRTARGAATPEPAAEGAAQSFGEAFESLPDTSFAAVTLALILSLPEPADVAITARQISSSTADEVRKLTVALVDRDVELEIDAAERKPLILEPARALRIVEHLDARAEVPPLTVSVYGTLRGANSRGEGTFEIETDPDADLPDVLRVGSRSAGSIVRGTLTQRARGQIREGNLWDFEVHARVQVQRSRRRGSLRVENLRMMSVEPRYPPGA